MRTRRLLGIVAVAAVAATACNRDEPAAQRTRQTPAQTPAETASQQPTDDASITTSVQARYYGDDAVRGRDISVSTQDGVVTLEGRVDSEAAKERAVALAREVPGVTSVEDELRVGTETADTAAAREPREPDTGVAGTSGETATREPGWITTKIQAQYFVSSDIKPWNIDVTTSNNGVVRLEGEVDSTGDKAEAVRIARATEGVSKVDDRLRVRGEKAAGEDAPAPVPSLSRPDPWLTAKVQSKYFLDDEVKGHEIDVETNEGVVTLTGSVASEAQRRQAVALARSTEGVRDVVDRLKVVSSAASGNQPRPDATGAAPDIDMERPDEWITMKIQSKYFLDDDVKGHRIDVDTAKGVVTLQGTVATEALKQEAEEIARETEGVTRVTNQLRVGQSKG